MKIEEGCPIVKTLGTPRVDQASVGRSTMTRRQADSGDSAQISSDVQLVSTAVSAVAAAPATRADRVEGARQAVATDRVGRDPWSLADKMIDSLLER
jgi:Anti-sigma-28 factor, FlgM